MSTIHRFATIMAEGLLHLITFIDKIIEISAPSITILSELPKQLVKAGVTIRFVVLFFKGAFIELPETKGANEVFWVELPEHGGDAAAGDGLVAAGAEGTSLSVVVSFTVWLPLVLEE